MRVEGRNPSRGSRARGSRGRSRDPVDDDDGEEFSWLAPGSSSDRYLPPPAERLPPPPAGHLPGQLWTAQTDRKRSVGFYRATLY